VRGKALAFLRIRLTSKLTNDRYRKMSCSNRMIQHVSNFLGEYNSSALQEEVRSTNLLRGPHQIVSVLMRDHDATV
jgi:hypothetical protein